MKLNKNIKVFCLRIKDYSLSIKLLNSNERLSKIIERLKKSSNRYVKLDYLLNLNYSKKSFSGVIGSQVVHINLFEIVGDTTFTLEEIKNSTLFIEELELLSVIGIHDNIFHRSLKRIISSQIHLN